MMPHGYISLPATILLLGPLLLGGTLHLRASCPPRLLGIWEYRQAAGAGYDPEGERLELSCSRGTLDGLYYGLEREGDEGLYYTLVVVRDAAVTQAGEFSFIVPARELYRERPWTIADLEQARLPSSGLTRDELHFSGRLEQDMLVLACTARMGSCPERKMVFQRVSGGLR